MHRIRPIGLLHITNFTKDPPFIPRPLLDVMARERIRNFELELRIFNQIMIERPRQSADDYPRFRASLPS